MIDTETRQEVADYMNGYEKERNLLSYFDLVRCCTCGQVLLDDDEGTHSYLSHVDDNKYCDTCWDAR